MTQIFRASANTIARASIVAFLALAVGGLCLLDRLHKSPYVRYTHVAREQPVPFSHKHHVNMGIDCRYCHNTVEESSFANVPPTMVCMNCHAQIFKDAPMLEPVRESFREDTSIEWIRVNDLPDHVYFDHSIHVNKGIGCETCHGPVDEMPLTWREEPLFMKWCLDCHREPEKFIRPRDQVFATDYEAPKDQVEQGRELVEAYNIKSANHGLTDCWICHR